MDPIFMALWRAYGFLAGRNALVLNTCINGIWFWIFSVIIYAETKELNGQNLIRLAVHFPMN